MSNQLNSQQTSQLRKKISSQPKKKELYCGNPFFVDSKTWETEKKTILIRKCFERERERE